jgi:hypothetical protein
MCPWPKSRTRVSGACARLRSPFYPVLQSCEPPAPSYCADAFVSPGVTVNESAIFGAEVIVLKDLKPCMIGMENTARD